MNFNLLSDQSSKIKDTEEYKENRKRWHNSLKSCVCIGQTTSKYAKRYSNKVLSCKVPTIENVINETIKLFEK